MYYSYKQSNEKLYTFISFYLRLHINNNNNKILMANTSGNPNAAAFPGFSGGHDIGNASFIRL